MHTCGRCENASVPCTRDPSEHSYGLALECTTCPDGHVSYFRACSSKYLAFYTSMIFSICLLLFHCELTAVCILTVLDVTTPIVRGIFQKFLSLPCSFVQRHFKEAYKASFKKLPFTFIAVLILFRCTVLFNNYSILYIADSIPLTCFHVIEL